MIETNVKRCTGHCCELFSLPFSPAQLKAKAKENKRYNNSDEEIRKVTDMVIYVGYGLEINENSVLPFTRHFKPTWNYTCRYWNKDTGDCMNYDDRPNMCRDYPDDRWRGCGKRGCTASKPIGRKPLSAKEFNQTVMESLACPPLQKTKIQFSSKLKENIKKVVGLS